jgi:DNA polymerase-3 subunit gamma/tau
MPSTTPAGSETEPSANGAKSNTIEENSSNPSPSAHPPLPEIASDFDRAVKNFAQFFNGQVVDMDDDIDALISGGRQPSEAAAKQPSHADKDVPF